MGDEYSDFSYRERGFYLGDTGLSDQILAVRKRFTAVFSELAVSQELQPITNDEGIISLYRSENRPAWVAAYDQLRYLPEVAELCGHPKMREIAARAGIRFPAVAVTPIVRADMPSDDKWDFPPHQDYVYNQGSLNAITLWIPFQDVSTETGPLRVIPGSHREGHLPNNKGDGTLVNCDQSKFINVPMKLGQILVFSQFLVHASGRNVGPSIRFSLQLRFNDLSASDYKDRRYYLNESRTIKADSVMYKTWFPLT